MPENTNYTMLFIKKQQHKKQGRVKHSKVPLNMIEMSYRTIYCTYINIYCIYLLSNVPLSQCQYCKQTLNIISGHMILSCEYRACAEVLIIETQDYYLVSMLWGKRIKILSGSL